MNRKSQHNNWSEPQTEMWRRFLRHPSFLNRWIVLLMGAIFLLVACEELPNPFQSKLPASTAANRLPETHLFLNFAPDTVDTTIVEVTDSLGTRWDTTITYIRHLPDTTTSQQVLHWWGEDPDGEVVGYYIKWNFQSDWTYTTDESDTFFLPLQVMYDEFSFQVKAVDDSNGVDPTPAAITLPVANQPPVIEWAVGSNPTVGADPNVEQITFPTRTFVWTVRDPDGAATVSRVRWALDDSSQWHYLPGNATSQTLSNLSAGNHTFYVQAIDTAGAASNLLSYPDSNDITTANGWRVKEPVGDVLLVDDYRLDNGNTRAFYTSILDSMYGDTSYTIWEVRDGVQSPPYALNDQVAMLGYFKTVIWYHVSDAPHLPDVNGGLRAFLENGGNLFVSSLRVDPNYTFTSIDSNFVLNPTGRMLAGLTINLVDPTVTDSVRIIPELAIKTDALIARRVSGYLHGNLDFGATSRDLFILQDPRNANDNWTGNPPVAQLFKPNPGAGQSIFFSLPFNVCNGNDNMYAVMDYILNQIFE